MPIKEIRDFLRNLVVHSGNGAGIRPNVLRRGNSMRLVAIGTAEFARRAALLVGVDEHELLRLDGRQCRATQLRTAELVLLGLGASSLDLLEGIETCKRVRSLSSVPVVSFGTHLDGLDKAAVLNAGADECVDRAQDRREIVARVNAVLRRTGRSLDRGPHSADALEYAGMRIDPWSRTVVVADSSVRLTPKEFDLLYCLASNPGKVMSRQRLMRDAWGVNVRGYDVGSGRSVDTHLWALRRKLGDNASIETLYGVGFRFVLPVQGIAAGARRE